MYAKDISKKVRSSRKEAQKEGKFMGSTPSYGYKRSADDKHKLVIDEYAAKIVKRIFTLCANHHSIRSIADTLNQENILPPQVYYYDTLGKDNPYKKSKKTWCTETVKKILLKEVYLGHTVQGKQTVKSFKNKERLMLPPEMWQIVENTHEAIIDKETWNAVQYVLQVNKNQKPRNVKGTREVSLFTGLVKCMDCGSNMQFNSNKKVSKIDYYYRCQNYIQHHDCTPHRITLDILSSVVLQDIRKNAQLASADEEAFIKELHNISMKERKTDINAYKKREVILTNRLKEIDNLIQQAFEKNCSGVLNDKMFQSLLAKYEKEKIEAEYEIDNLQIELVKAESDTRDIEKDIRRLKQFAEISALDRKTVTSLIDCIYISEPRIENKEKVYDIEIRYKFHNKKDTTLNN